MREAVVARGGEPGGGGWGGRLRSAHAPRSSRPQTGAHQNGTWRTRGGLPAGAGVCRGRCARRRPGALRGVPLNRGGRCGGGRPVAHRRGDCPPGGERCSLGALWRPRRQRRRRRHQARMLPSPHPRASSVRWRPPRRRPCGRRQAASQRTAAAASAFRAPSRPPRAARRQRLPAARTSGTSSSAPVAAGGRGGRAAAAAPAGAGASRAPGGGGGGGEKKGRDQAWFER